MGDPRQDGTYIYRLARDILTSSPTHSISLIMSQTKMEYVNLGKSGLKVSSLTLNVSRGEPITDRVARSPSSFSAVCSMARGRTG